MTTILRHLLHSADPAECAASSFDDFHARGLSYVNLLRTPRLTAKLYIAEPGALAPSADGYVVNPHNHGYCFETFVVCGEMQNITFTESDGVWARRWDEFAFSSALRGEPRIERVRNVGLVYSTGPRLRAGASYYLDDKTIHTIRVSREEPTILFLLQFEDTGTGPTRLFTRDGAAPSLDGLYRPMQVKRVADLIDRAKRIVEQGEAP